jgi:hypothetical protein
MKKCSWKQRERLVRLNIAFRQGRSKSGQGAASSKSNSTDYTKLQKWIAEKINNGEINATINGKRSVALILPSVMNFSTHYAESILYINAIRRLAPASSPYKQSLRLGFVNFEFLTNISSSAALALTAELSKWNDHMRSRLVPRVRSWKEETFRKFYQLGFFELFRKTQDVQDMAQHVASPDEVKFIQYIKGQSGDVAKTDVLKERIKDVLQDDLTKWTFLYTGLSEAITNVVQHAYPEGLGYNQIHKNWYLSGAYNPNRGTLKIVFYDQGAGIPNTLPTSGLWERVLGYLSVIGLAESKRDEVLLRAAVEIERTSTDEEDRGKGLQDLLEFINQRGQGYLSILSRRGLYKYTVDNGDISTKSVRFDDPIEGTLIIWRVNLES